MALAVPTHLENEAESASRRLNALGLTRNQARRTSHGRTLRSGFPDSPLRHFTGKFAYISLNTPTPCPPRGAVPVNLGKPCCDAWAGFRQELGKECDSSHALREVELNSSARPSDVSHENSFRSSERYWIASSISFGRMSGAPARSASVLATFRIRSCARAEKLISSMACSR